MVKVMVSVFERAAGLTLACALAIGCGSSSDDGGNEDTNQPTAAVGAAGMGGGTDAAGMGAAGTASAGTDSSAAGTAGVGGSAGMATGGASGRANLADGPQDITPPPADVMEMLDPDTDWEALTIIYPTMYSAYDGEHTFQVWAYVDGSTIELSGWQAIPEDSVSIEEDPTAPVEGTVLITVLKPEKQITIAASDSGIGGTAALFITEGTPEQWAAGEARYYNGVEYDLNLMVDFSQILDPNWMPPDPPDNLACNNCHTTGAKYFEFQHNPAQAARFSDDELATILTMGKKPEGVGYRILPDMLGNQTAEELYASFHTWDASEDEVKGLIIYLRSLTPEGQGDIRLPDGTYVPAGTMPSDAMMMMQ